MDINEEISSLKNLQILVLKYLGSNSNKGDSLEEIMSFLNNANNQPYPYLNEIIELILYISTNFKHNFQFFNKIEKIIIPLKEAIKQNFSQSDIFNIFKKNKRILLFLIEEKVIEFDKFMANYLMSPKYRQKNYHIYFHPEIKNFLDEESKNRIEQKLHINDDNFLQAFTAKRRIGENDNLLCQIIRDDLLDKFITYYQENNISIFSKIEPSIYETNSYIADKKLSLIEYSAFFGSEKIFNYLISNQIEITPSLWIYAVHGQNMSILQKLKDLTVHIPFNDCYIESIKCHNNEFVKYFDDCCIKDAKIEKRALSKILKYRNYILFPDNFINSLHSFEICKYNCLSIAGFLSKTQKFKKEINEMREITKRNCLNSLHIAVKKRNTQIVKLLLSIDINVDAKAQIEFTSQKRINIFTEATALHMAIEQENEEIVELLLNHSTIDINCQYQKTFFYVYKTEKYLKTALHMAVEINNSKIVSLLIKKENIKINEVLTYTITKSDNYLQNQYKTALFMAVQNCNQEIVQMLTSRIDIDSNIPFISKEEAQSKYYEEIPPLAIACKLNQFQIVNYLLSCPNINVNCREILSFESSKSNFSYDYFPLNIAIKNSNLDIVQSLLKHHDIDVNAKEKHISQKSNEKKEGNEKNALLIAIQKDNLDVVKLLLLNPNIKVNEICTNFLKETLYDLVSIPNEPNRLDIFDLYKTEENSALHLAIIKGNIEIINLLLSHKEIDVNIINNNNTIKTKLLRENGQIKSTDITKEEKEMIAPLHLAIASNNYEIAKHLLLHQNIDVNIKYLRSKMKYIEEKYPLYIAIEKNNKSIVDLLLLKKEIDVNTINIIINSRKFFTMKRDDQTTRIFEATYAKSMKIPEMNLTINFSFGDEINKSKNSTNEFNEKLEHSDNNIFVNKINALTLAVTMGNIEIIKNLLSRSEIKINPINYYTYYSLAEPVIKSSFKFHDDKTVTLVSEMTALHVAIVAQNLEVTELLLKHKDIDVNIKFNETRAIDGTEIVLREKHATPLHLAIEKENFEIFELLINQNNIDLNAEYFYSAFYYDAENKYGYYKTTKMNAMHLAIEQGFAARFFVCNFILLGGRVKCNCKSYIKKETIDRKLLIVIEDTELTHAVRKGNAMTVKDLLYSPTLKINSLSYEKMIDSNITPEINALYGFDNDEEELYEIKEPSALHIAVSEKNVEIVDLLLKTGEMDINEVLTSKSLIEKHGKLFKENKKSPLHIAIENNDSKMVEFLLKNKDIDVNMKQYDLELGAVAIQRKDSMHSLSRTEEDTPLHMAIINGNESIVKLLLAHKKTLINQKKISKQIIEDKNVVVLEKEYNEIQLAAEHNNVEIVKYLIENEDIEINSLSYEKKFFGVSEKEIKQLFGYEPTDFRIIYNVNKKTALHIAIESGHLEIVKALLASNKIDTNSISITGDSLESDSNILKNRRMTPLHKAIDQQNGKIVMLLLAQESVDVNNKYYYNGLLNFEKMQVIDELDYIFETEEMTGLHIAIQLKNPSIVALLLKDKRTQVNIKMLHTSEYKNHKIIKSQKEFYEIHLAAEIDKKKILELLLERQEIELNSFSYYKKFTSFCIQDIPPIFGIITNDYVPNYEEEEKTALHIAVEKDQYKIISLLLDHKKVDVNIKSIKRKVIKDKNYILLLEEVPVIHLAGFMMAGIVLKRKDIDINSYSFHKTFTGVADDQMMELFHSTQDDDRKIYKIEEKTLLSKAVSSQDFELTRLLVSIENLEINKNNKITEKAGEKIVFEDSESNSLHEAVEVVDNNIIKLLLSRDDIDVNSMKHIKKIEGIVNGKLATYSEKGAPIHYSILLNKISSFNELLKNKGIDIDIKYNACKMIDGEVIQDFEFDVEELTEKRGGTFTRQLTIYKKTGTVSDIEDECSIM